MVKIEEISNQNPWWKYGVEFTNYDPSLQTFQKQRIPIERKKFELKPGRIGVIRGCRQIGKTTYMKVAIDDLIKAGTDPRRILYLSVDWYRP